MTIPLSVISLFSYSPPLRHNQRALVTVSFGRLVVLLLSSVVPPLSAVLLYSYSPMAVSVSRLVVLLLSSVTATNTLARASSDTVVRCLPLTPYTSTSALLGAMRYVSLRARTLCGIPTRLCPSCSCTVVLY